VITEIQLQLVSKLDFMKRIAVGCVGQLIDVEDVVFLDRLVRYFLNLGLSYVCA
jgi:hypothetical protein